MITQQFLHHYLEGWNQPLDSNLDSESTLVILFGSSKYFGRRDVFKELECVFLKSTIVGCSGGGVFLNDEIWDDALIATVVRFDQTSVRHSALFNNRESDAAQLGATLIHLLKDEEPAGLFILGDGLKTNGESLLHGMQSESLHNTLIWGGMAGDGTNFQRNWLYCNGETTKHGVIAVGFYGDQIEFRTRVGGGWKNFGPQHKVTDSDGSRVFALDDRPMLDIYSEYLGKLSGELPAIGARYPLRVDSGEVGRSDYLRSVLEIDEKTRSMRFAGDVPNGAIVQMMRGDLRSLLLGASSAALDVAKEYTSMDEGIVIACNCIGRRMVLGSQADLELNAIRSNMPEAIPMVGFYSLGEFAQPDESIPCEFLNETITLTTMIENYGSVD